jgi:GT2 family glycosyltransferase
MHNIAPIAVDIIILSNSDSLEKKRMTEKAIESLLASEEPSVIRFNVVIIESCKTASGYGPQYGQTIIPPGKFGFNRFLNIGIAATSAEFVCLCNNDLIFHTHWASHLLSAMTDDPTIESCCPFCGNYHPTRGISQNNPPVFGYHYEALIGWCIFVKRSVLRRIGPLDEKIVFWYAERDYGNHLAALGVKHALIPAARVDHLGSQSIKDCSTTQRHRLTSLQQYYFDYKWGHKSRLKLWLQRAWFFPQMALGSLASCFRRIWSKFPFPVPKTPPQKPSNR